MTRAPGARRLELRAPAKLNLFLAVGGVRPDGFHELVTVMQTLQLHDSVQLQLEPAAPGAPDEVQLRLEHHPPCAEGSVPSGADNLAVRAARALLAATPAAAGRRVHVRLVKRVPVGAGLGGGSSDAAAVLRGLNELLGQPCGADRLASLAGQLGSDVPFFLHGGTALCTGRGERVEPLPSPLRFEVTLLLPAFGVSTALAYRALDAQPGAGGHPALDPRALRRAVDGADVAALERLYRNDLERAAQAVQPALGGWLGRPGVHLCGSGSSLFRYGATHAGAVTHESPLMRIVSTRSRNH